MSAARSGVGGAQRWAASVPTAEARTNGGRPINRKYASAPIP
jgi:hypothetical protein